MKIRQMIAFLINQDLDRELVVCAAPNVDDWCQDIESGRVGETSDGKLVLALTEETTTPDESENITWREIKND